MGKGGGSAPTPTSQTVNQTNLPEYARPYFEDILNRGQAASQVQYQPFTGQRVADFNPLQQQAFQGIQGLGVSPLIGAGAGMTGAAGVGGLQAQNQYTQQATSPGAMQAYMSPFMQNVVDWQKTQAINDYGRQLPGMQANATRAGAFGGSRQAIVESEAQRNLQNQLAGIQATGTQQAFDQANKNLQFGSQLGIQGLDLAGRMGGQFGQLGQTAFGQQAGAAQAQQQAGAIQQAQEQQKMDTNYEEFMRQQFYPQSQLQFYSSLLRGVPVAPQQTMYSYQQAPSMASQIGGLGLGALGLSQAFKATGGEVKSYATGGITGEGAGGLSSNVAKLVKLLMASQNPDQDAKRLGGTPIEKYLALQKVQQMRGAMQNQQALDRGVPQGTVMDEMGVAGLDMPESEYAGGGIVAFEDGGVPRGQRPFDITDPFGLVSLYRRPRTYATPAEEERARRLDALAAERVPAVPAAPTGIAAALAPQDVPGTARQIEGHPASRPEDFAKPTGIASVLPMPTTPVPVTTTAATPTASRSVARATTATQETAPEPDSMKTLRDGLKGLESPDDAAKQRREALRGALPDDLAERLGEFKAQAEQAKKDRDQDRWLAVAMGGFAAAAGSSPYALKNFGEGLGLTTKELMNVNKDFRKAEQERKKLETEEKRLARAEALGIEKEVQAAADKALARRDAYNKAITTAELELKKIAEKRFETTTRAQSDADRTAAVRAASAAANRTPAEIQMVERIAAEKKIPFAEALKYYIQTAQPQRLAKPEDPLIAALTGGAGMGSGLKLTPEQQKLLEKYK